MRVNERVLQVAGSILFAVLAVSPAKGDGSAVAPSTQPSMLPPGDWKLIWQDDFDYPDAKLDEIWDAQNGPNTHILCSRWRENVKVSDGTLKLINRKEKRGGQDWTSGSIWTKRSFQYGYYECRYRYAAAPATNNSFWIMTRIGDEPVGTTKFEIDINEGHYPSEVSTNIHNWSDVKVIDGRKHHPSSSKSFNFGMVPDCTVQLEIPVTARKIRFSSEHGHHFHVREFRAFGPLDKGKKYPDARKAVPADGPADFARDPKATLSVSGFYKPDTQATVSNLTDNDPQTSWISQGQGTKWVELDLGQARTIGCVQLLSGWTDTKSWFGMPENYKVQYLDGDKWIDMKVFDVKTGAYNFARDFHVFGLDWNKEELVFYVDGKEIRREKNLWAHSPAPVWLSLAIITWSGPVTDAIDGTFMEVDYVRVFEKVSEGQ